ncbi:MAG TPA: hypothetical protein VMD92_09830 [Acidobacteriaceae bacterium]|nr:hypothetical protein [Acidobacteriaceae bacterium]
MRVLVLATLRTPRSFGPNTTPTVQDCTFERFVPMQMSPEPEDNLVRIRYLRKLSSQAA